MPGRPSTHDYRGTVPARSQTARVVDDLGLAIISGRYGQGSLLPGDAELMAHYGVSRTVLREGLKTLSAKGLLLAKARIGTRVRERARWNLFDPDVLVWHARVGFAPDFLRQLGEMRMALEPEAAALAAGRRSAADLAAMEEWLARMSAPKIAPAEFVKADLGLHLAIASAADNPFFLSISTLIEVALVAMLTVSSPVENLARLTASVAEHRVLVEAVAAGDAAAARAAMQAVVQTGIDFSHAPP
jgi:DNA-binding FadR family transcriptional regulator